MPAVKVANELVRALKVGLAEVDTFPSVKLDNADVKVMQRGEHKGKVKAVLTFYVDPGEKTDKEG